MQDGNPTAQPSGASTLERLESFLAAKDAPEPKEPAEAQAVEASEAEAQAEADPVVETSEDAPEESDESLVELSDVARFLGVEADLLDVDDDGTVSIKTKIDGKEGKAKLKDFLATYQKSGHVDNESRAVAEQRKALQAERQAAQDQARQQAEYLNGLTQQAQNELLAEYNQIDWAALSRSDPAEYVAKQHEFQARSNRLADLGQQAQAELAKDQQQRAQAYQAYLAQEGQRLVELVPEWANADTQAKEKAALIDWGVKSGIPEQALKSISSASMVAALRKAMLFDQSKAAASVAEKKVRAAPKLVKPGQSTDARQRATQELDSIRSQIRKSGGKQGVIDYLVKAGLV